MSLVRADRSAVRLNGCTRERSTCDDGGGRRQRRRRRGKHVGRYGRYVGRERSARSNGAGGAGSVQCRTDLASGLEEALDAPVRFAEHSPCAFGLLFPPNDSVVRSLSTPRSSELRQRARGCLRALSRLASNERFALPKDACDAAVFVEGICLASALIPELRASVTLRRRWQAFCLHTDERDSAL